MSLGQGALISGRYRLTRHIATGGMGAVWVAEDSVLDREVAVKVLKPEYSSDAEFVERFRSEAKVTARISHPGVAAVYDYGQVDDPSTGAPLSYLVMELVKGEPLSDVLARESRLPLRHTLDMLEQTARALEAAHSIGLVHRDVKPGNILITPTGQVKLTDFGIAKSMGSAAVTQTGMVVGTAQYIAPEQAMGEDTAPSGDIYSLAVVGYECLAGRRPFVADSPVTVAMMHVRDEPPALSGEIPPPVRTLIGYAMAKDPRARYASGAGFADAIADVRAGREPRPPAGLARTGRTSRIPGAAAGAAAAGAAGVGAASAAGRPDATRAFTRVERGQVRPAETSSTTSSRRVAAPYHQPPTRRRGAGCGVWALVGLLLLAALAVVGAIALSRSGVLDPTPADTTTTVRTTPSPTPAPEPSQDQPSSTRERPTRSSQPSRSSSSSSPTSQDQLGDILDSLTSQLNSVVPTPGTGGGTGNNGNGNPGNNGHGNGNAGGFGGIPGGNIAPQGGR